MAGAISARKKPGRPRVGSTNIGVRLPPDQLAALDKFIAKQPEPKPTRPEAIRRMVAEHLSGVRLLPTRPDLRKPKDAEPPRGNVQFASAGTVRAEQAQVRATNRTERGTEPAARVKAPLQSPRDRKG